MQINDKWIIRSSICPVSYVASNLLGRLKSFFIYKEIMDAQHFPFYIILSNYVWSILFYQDKNYNVRHIRFHVCIKMRCCKRRACKRKTLAEQLKRYLKFNSFSFFYFFYFILFILCFHFVLYNLPSWSLNLILWDLSSEWEERIRESLQVLSFH